MKRLLPLLLICLLFGCSKQIQQTTIPATVPTEPAVTTVPAETTMETAAPTTAPVEVSTIYHSAIREDGSFSEGALLIGDSLTYRLITDYLRPNGLLGDARYMAIPGAAITSFAIDPRMYSHNSVFSPEYRGLLMCEAVDVAGEKTTAIYFMLGTNYSPYATDQMYIDAVQRMLDSCPNATIYLQLVPYETSAQLDYVSANQRIRDTHFYFAIRGEQRVVVLDTQTPIGYNLAYDGIHLSIEGLRLWHQALVDYAAQNHIPQ